MFRQLTLVGTRNYCRGNTSNFAFCTVTNFFQNVSVIPNSLRGRFCSSHTFSFMNILDLERKIRGGAVDESAI